ncbi:ribosomal protein L9, N-terminal domain-containing protein [Toxoplasma gondii MAS]|uniref:Ribosomal protein L9, N-terminal domain-containing protein n=1 Tax=Toxoplasma gondii MAS TaxID=943118 RepID=A0A086QV15_TOXGO|nr:ribosomal protein L9, N-terminal domain-containing protein [Toxoplasma gondii MAS]
MTSCVRSALSRGAASAGQGSLSVFSLRVSSSQHLCHFSPSLCPSRPRPAEKTPRSPLPSQDPQGGEELPGCGNKYLPVSRFRPSVHASEADCSAPSLSSQEGRQKLRGRNARARSQGAEQQSMNGEAASFSASVFLSSQRLLAERSSEVSTSGTCRRLPPSSGSSLLSSVAVSASGVRCLADQRRGFAISHLNPSISKGKVHYRVPNPYIPVLLLQAVPGLGKRGELKQVRRGTLRLFLAPKGLAVVASWQNIDAFYLAEKEEEERRRRAQASRGGKQLRERGGDRGDNRLRGAGDEEGDGEEGDSLQTDSRRAKEDGEDEEELTTEGGTRGEDAGHAPVASFLNKYRAQFLVNTEDTDPTRIRGNGVSLFDLLNKVSEETELDLLPSQLAIGRRQKQSEEQIWSGSGGGRERRRADERREEDEEEKMRQDGVITRCGVYTVHATIPLKNRTARKSFLVEILSKQEAERILQEKQRREEEEARRSDFALGEE